MKKTLAILTIILMLLFVSALSSAQELINWPVSNPDRDLFSSIIRGTTYIPAPGSASGSSSWFTATAKNPFFQCGMVETETSPINAFEGYAYGGGGWNVTVFAYSNGAGGYAINTDSIVWNNTSQPFNWPRGAYSFPIPAQSVTLDSKINTPCVQTVMRRDSLHTYTVITTGIDVTTSLAGNGVFVLEELVHGTWQTLARQTVTAASPVHDVRTMSFASGDATLRWLFERPAINSKALTMNVIIYQN